VSGRAPEYCAKSTTFAPVALATRSGHFSVVVEGEEVKARKRTQVDDEWAERYFGGWEKEGQDRGGTRGPKEELGKGGDEKGGEEETVTRGIVSLETKSKGSTRMALSSAPSFAQSPPPDAMARLNAGFRFQNMSISARNDGRKRARNRDMRRCAACERLQCPSPPLLKAWH